MAILKDRHNPSWILFPINDNCTAWKPISFPVILIVPHRRTQNGSPISDSGIFNVRIFIEDVPREALVAGHDHIGQRFPDKELYSESVDSLELADRAIAVGDYPITRNGVAIDFSEAKEGDLITYTTSTRIHDTIPYIPDADYYDLSDIKIDVELLPRDKYNLVYQTEFFYRITSDDDSHEFLCIDVNRVARSEQRLKVNHPGDVINEFYKLTPPPYLTNEIKSKDSTVELYRPFTTVLQDVMDEQDLLEKINWVFDTPPEAIPYLSSLLGWDLPYFPESLDVLRRAVLRRTVEFQTLAGTRRAIINLFRLFGFEILISNLWWSSDGKRFIRPGEALPSPYENEQITQQTVCQVDPLLNNWATTGFGEFSIPFLFRPQELAGFDDFQAARDGGDVTIEAYTVSKDSAAYTILQNLMASIFDDVENYGSIEGSTTDSNGFLNSVALSNAMDGQEVLGFSQILISGKLGEATKESLVGLQPPLKRNNISFNRETNKLQLTLNGYQDLENTAIFAFAVYERQKIVVPDIIANLQSNRFDIQVLTQSATEFADPITLEFSIEFLYRLKAFHSLLNVIRTRIELTETYNVTSFCVGGDRIQRYDTDAGMLQVPPAIIPNIPTDITDCTKLDPTSLGYKDSDILLRLRMLSSLPEEHEAWKVLDPRDDATTDGLQIAPMLAASNRTDCLYTQHGQDRIVGTRVEKAESITHPTPTSNQSAGVETNPKLSPVDASDNSVFPSTGPLVSSNSNSSPFRLFQREYTDIYVPLCELDGATDYCYKGRVDDEVLHSSAVVESEYVQFKPCGISMGSGSYYTYPATSITIVAGVTRPASRSLTVQTQFSGNAKTGGIEHYATGVQKEYLDADYNKPLSPKLNSHLGRLYRNYGHPPVETLHYTNRGGLTNLDQRYQLALQRPSLSIQKATMHLPGCRFPTMNAIESDFTHPTWLARPWDDSYSTACGPAYICKPEPTFLNCYLETNTDGDQTMVFDTVEFKVLGNGMTPDISSLGEHVVGTNSTFVESDVIHSVYMNDSYSPYVVLDQVCEYDSAVSADGTIPVTTPLFTSASECATGGMIDYADGYACVYGEQTYGGVDRGDYEEVLSGLGITFFDTSIPNSLFTFGSGIRFESAIRLDCGCLLAPCDVTSDGSTICSSSLYLDDDGQYDWNPDHVQIELRLLEIDKIGAHSYQLDGEIPSLLETV